jgi:hypothetical protein
MTNSTETSTTEPEFDAEAYLRADDAVMATDCGFPDCEGIGHEVFAPFAEWAHRLGHSAFDGATDIEFHKFGTAAPLAVLTMETQEEMTATQLRAEADLYEGYPAWLRTRADELDAFNA